MPITRARGRRTGKWTVMVFMGALNPTDGPMLDAAADLRELEAVGSDASLNILAQVHADGPPRRYHIGRRSTPVPVAEQRSENGKVLIDFIDWALETAKHRAGDRTLLVFWGHAFRFAVSDIATTTGVDGLDFGEIPRVLATVKRRLGGRRLDLIGFDACDCATIEVAHRLSPFADYLIASERGIPLPGWPYQTVLAQLRASRDRAPMSPENLGEYIVRRFCEEYAKRRPGAAASAVSLTLLDLRYAPAVFRATERLALAIGRAVAAPGGDWELANVQRAWSLAQASETKPFVDLATVCYVLGRWSRDPELGAAAATLGDLLIRPDAGDGQRGSLIVEHGRNSYQTAVLQGVSAYAPSVAPATHDPVAAAEAYSLLANGVARAVLEPGQETVWSELAYALAGID